MATKTHDLVVKTRQYKDRNGETKNVWKNVGIVMTNDDGGRFILFDRSFNPAGIPNPDNQDTVIISIFGVKNEGSGSNEPTEDYQSDDIPF